MGKIEYELIILLKTMNILIATQNQDKFRIIKGLLSNCAKRFECGKINHIQDYGKLIGKIPT
jgi:hypothetical protein